jgi:hypothetical protein
MLLWCTSNNVLFIKLLFSCINKTVQSIIIILALPAVAEL